VIQLHGRFPALRHDDVELWESNSIGRLLCMMVGGDARGLYPEKAGARANVDRWLDWQLPTLSPAERDLFWNMLRPPEEKRDMQAVANSARCRAIIEAQLSDGRPFIEGGAFTLADIVMGCFARRWFGPEMRVPGMPEFPHLAQWHARIGERPDFQRQVAPKLS